LAAERVVEVAQGEGWNASRESHGEVVPFDFRFDVMATREGPKSGKSNVLYEFGFIFGRSIEDLSQMKAYFPHLAIGLVDYNLQEGTLSIYVPADVSRALKKAADMGIDTGDVDPSAIMPLLPKSSSVNDAYRRETGVSVEGGN
jgi:hypothetical protein